MFQTHLVLPDQLLFVSTLNGTLYAINKHNGKVRWKLHEGKIIMLKNVQ